MPPKCMLDKIIDESERWGAVVAIESNDWEGEVLDYLKEYRTLLQGMQDKGIKTVTLADKQTVISAEPKAEQTAEKVSHVVRDSGNLVCECGQGVERWHMYCYHCGKKLVWDKVK